MDAVLVPNPNRMLVTRASQSTAAATAWRSFLSLKGGFFILKKIRPCLAGGGAYTRRPLVFLALAAMWASVTQVTSTAPFLTAERREISSLITWNFIVSNLG